MMLTEIAVLLLALVVMYHAQQLNTLNTAVRRLIDSRLLETSRSDLFTKLLDRMSQNHPMGGSRKAELEQTPYGEELNNG